VSRRTGSVAVLILALAAIAPSGVLAQSRLPADHAAGVASIPSDTTLFTDEFADLNGWTVTTGGEGTVNISATGGQDGGPAARITVPNYTTNSIAYLKHPLAAPELGLSAVGYFKVTSGGCDSSAGYSAGNVPFFRFFDGDGQRVVGLYRINGSCSKTAKLFVQHSGNYWRTGKNMSFGSWYKLELRAAVSTPGSSLVQVYYNDDLVYETNIANNGLKPFASVNIGNEHPNQVGDFFADKIRLASFTVTAPTNPCTASTPAPTTADPGTTVLADNFESFDFSKWSAVGLSGDATATIQTATVKSPTCAAKLHVTTNTASMANLSRTLPAGAANVYADGWFNVAADGLSGNNVPEFRFFSGASRVVDVYRVNGTGQMYLRLPNGAGGYQYVSLGRTKALNTWFSLNVHVVANGASSTVEVKIDGQSVLTRTVDLGTSTLSRVQIGAEHLAQAGDLIVDDVVIKNVP
jgi:hypothetical protein